MNWEKWIGMSIGIVGLCLIVWKAGAVVAIGVILAMWGNNLEQRAQSEEPRHHE